MPQLDGQTVVQGSTNSSGANSSGQIIVLVPGVVIQGSIVLVVQIGQLVVDWMLVLVQSSQGGQVDGTIVVQTGQVVVDSVPGVVHISQGEQLVGTSVVQGGQLVVSVDIVVQGSLVVVVRAGI